MTDTSSTVPPEPDEPMYAQLGEDGNPFSDKKSEDDDDEQPR